MKRSTYFHWQRLTSILCSTPTRFPSVGQSLMGTIEEFGGGKGANQACCLPLALEVAPFFCNNGR